jgi:hypothetical protein
MISGPRRLPNIHFPDCGHLLRNVADTSIRFVISAHGPHIRFALRYGLVHARASARVRNSAPGEVGPLSTCRASAAALVACSLQREEVRVGSTPLIMTSAILVEHHSETNAGTFITAVTKLVQPLALTGHSVLPLNRQAAKHNDAGNNYCSRDERRLDVHDCLPCRPNLNNLGLFPVHPDGHR